jgi:hypothetical protein
MKCLIYKWLISWSLDSKKNLPSYIRRHMQSCAGCREFARFSRSLDSRMGNDAEKLFANGPENLTINIPLEPSFPLEKRSMPKRRLFLIPAATTILAGLFFVVIVFLRPVFLQRAGSLPERIASIHELVVSEYSLPRVVTKAESPIESEWLSLQKAVKSTSDFFVSCFDFGIDMPQE